jgi:hypothetical protein
MSKISKKITVDGGALVIIDKSNSDELFTKFLELKESPQGKNYHTILLDSDGYFDVTVEKVDSLHRFKDMKLSKIFFNKDFNIYFPSGNIEITGFSGDELYIENNSPRHCYIGYKVDLYFGKVSIFICENVEKLHSDLKNFYPQIHLSESEIRFFEMNTTEKYSITSLVKKKHKNYQLEFHEFGKLKKLDLGAMEVSHPHFWSLLSGLNDLETLFIKVTKIDSKTYSEMNFEPLHKLNALAIEDLEQFKSLHLPSNLKTLSLKFVQIPKQWPVITGINISELNITISFASKLKVQKTDLPIFDFAEIKQPTFVNVK